MVAKSADRLTDTSGQKLVERTAACSDGTTGIQLVDVTVMLRARMTAVHLDEP